MQSPSQFTVHFRRLPLRLEASLQFSGFIDRRVAGAESRHSARCDRKGRSRKVLRARTRRKASQLSSSASGTGDNEIEARRGNCRSALRLVGPRTARNASRRNRRNPTGWFSRFENPSRRQSLFRRAVCSTDVAFHSLPSAVCGATRWSVASGTFIGVASRAIDPEFDCAGNVTRTTTLACNGFHPVSAVQLWPQSDAA